MRTKLFWVKLTLTVLTLLFIWGNSLLPAEVSGEESGRVLELVQPAAEAMQRFLAQRGVDLSLMIIVRKLAHFTEYAVLGALMLTLLVTRELRMFPLRSWALCAAAALLDEGIQLLIPERGPALRDVLIDSIGACMGIILAALAVWIFRTARRKRNRRIDNAASDG